MDYRVYVDLLDGENHGFAEDENGSYLFGRDFIPFGPGHIVVERRRTDVDTDGKGFIFVPTLIIYNLIGKEKKGHPIYRARDMSDEEIATAKGFLEKKVSESPKFG